MKEITALDDNCLYYMTAPEAPETEPLEGDAETECAIVGGGYTGLVTALRLAERGIAATVLEARDIGFGGSGRNLGHCTPTLHFWSHAKIRKLYGDDYGERIMRLYSGGADAVFSLIEQYQIQCEAVRNGYLRGAGASRDLKGLEDNMALYARYGLKSRILSKEEVEERSGSPRFQGGWLLEGGGHINPLGYSRGLARAALAQGAKIHTDSPVDGVAREGAQWRLTTPRGSLRANKVLMATGAYTVGPPWPGLTRAFYKVPVAGLATAPLDPALRDKVLKYNNSITSTHGEPAFFRWDNDNRLITSVRTSGDFGTDPEKTKAIMTEKARWFFPDLGDVHWEHYWFGLVDGQYNTVPRLFRLDDNVWSCLGYSGRGVPTATALGADLADLFAGGDPGALTLPVEPLKRVMPGLGTMHQAYIAWGRIRDRIDARREGTEAPPVL